MSSESRHDRVAALFAAVRALPPEQRAAFLDAECAADAELLAEVEELLALAQGGDSLLDRGPGTTMRRRAERSLLEAVDDAPMPEMIGDYRIVGVLGRGGMGVV